MMLPLSLLLPSLLSVAAPLAVVADSLPNCDHNKWTGQIIPQDVPCICDRKGSVCQPDEFCAVYLSQEALQQEGGELPSDMTTLDDIDPALLECRTRPCDDLSGDWIWYGRNPHPWTGGNYSVWATVQATQNNCQVVLTASTIVGSGGGGQPDDEHDGFHTRAYHGEIKALGDVYLLYLFDTEDDLGSFQAAVNGGEASTSEDLLGNSNFYFFLQNFGDGAQDKQACEYFGSLFRKGVVELPESVDSYSGTLARDVGGVFSVGDIIPQNGEYIKRFRKDPCPEGYPRGWSARNDSSPPPNADSDTPSPLFDYDTSPQEESDTTTASFDTSSAIRRAYKLVLEKSVVVSAFMAGGSVIVSVW